MGIVGNKAKELLNKTASESGRPIFRQMASKSLEIPQDSFEICVQCGKKYPRNSLSSHCAVFP
jgi:hypothetical protein